MNIGYKIKKVRKLRNMTQSELGKKIGGKGKHQISAYESGKVIPSVEALIKISKVLSVSLDYLANDEIKDIKFIPKIKDNELLIKFEKADNLPDSKKKLIKELIESVVFHHDIKTKVTT